MLLSKARDAERKQRIRFDARIGFNCFHCQFSELCPDGNLRCSRNIPPNRFIGYGVQPNQKPCNNFVRRQP